MFSYLACSQRKQSTVNMTRAKKNPKLNHEQWLLIQKENIKMIVELQQENEKLKAEVQELKVKEVELEGKNKKLKEKYQEHQAGQEVADGNKKMRSVTEPNSKILIEFVERQILELEEELECPVCLEVASAPPIFKCPDNHLICRFILTLLSCSPFLAALASTLRVHIILSCQVYCRLEYTL